MQLINDAVYARLAHDLPERVPSLPVTPKLVADAAVAHRASGGTRVTVVDSTMPTARRSVAHDRAVTPRSASETGLEMTPDRLRIAADDRKHVWDGFLARVKAGAEDEPHAGTGRQRLDQHLLHATYALGASLLERGEVDEALPADARVAIRAALERTRAGR